MSTLRLRSFKADNIYVFKDNEMNTMTLFIVNTHMYVHELYIDLFIYIYILHIFIYIYNINVYIYTWIYNYII